MPQPNAVAAVELGGPVDGIGSCGSILQALLTGQPAAFAHAMAAASDGGCGAPTRSFAQHLDGSNVGIGFCLPGRA
jgi:hypothetical protein